MKYIRQSHANTIEARATTAFRAAYAAHPDRESDPGQALTVARDAAARLVPAGVEISINDETLSVVVARGQLVQREWLARRAAIDCFVTGDVAVDDGILAEVAAAAGGAYQRALLAGEQSWSGADLQGKAQGYAGRYAAGRRALAARINAALAPHGLRAEVAPVLRGTPPRWHSELVISRA